jgi:hypothetical protein
VAAVEDFLVEVGAKLLEIVQAVGHRSSVGGAAVVSRWVFHYEAFWGSGRSAEHGVALRQGCPLPPGAVKGGGYGQT